MSDRELMECGPDALREMVVQLEEQVEELKRQRHDAMCLAFDTIGQPLKEVRAAIHRLNTPSLSELAPQLAVLQEINSKLDQFIAITTRITELIEQ